MKQNNIKKLSIVKVLPLHKAKIQTRNPLAKKLHIPSSEGISLVNKADILRIESSGNYTHIFTKDSRKFTVSKTMKSVIFNIEEDVFIRVHNSHVVNINEITFIGNSQLELSDLTKIPISRSYKSALMSLLDSIK